MTAKVYFDTNFLISTFEAEGAASFHGWAVMSALEAGNFLAVTSKLTLAELLPRPMSQSDMELVGTYTQLLTDNPVLIAMPVSRDILISAARLRAYDRSLRLPDGIHLATAVAQDCTIFLTDDLRLKPPKGLRRLPLTAATLDQIEGSMP